VKLAILGGSFDPVHVGHLFLADAALCALAYDRIILIPAFQSPFKAGVENATSRDRLEMLASSIAGDPRLTIDDCEIRREGVSYTIDTLKDIIERYKPDGKPGLIIGDDLVSTFDQWHSPEEIASLADVIIARRLSGTSEGCVTGNFPYPHINLANEIMSISSSQIREKIGRNENWRYLVPAGARHLIKEKRLYGLPASPDGETILDDTVSDNIDLTGTIVRLENEVRAILSFEKFSHSRNTALLAWDLCRRFGLDCQKGYLAGISHDICKAMDKSELIRLAQKDGGSISKLERHKSGLLHGRAGAVVLARKYGVTDKEVLDAVRYHTTGNWDMNALAKVIYVADKIEISRHDVDPALRKMSRNSDLDALFRAVLKEAVSFLKSKQVDISYGTRRLLVAMQKRNES